MPFGIASAQVDMPGQIVAAAGQRLAGTLRVLASVSIVGGSSSSTPSARRTPGIEGGAFFDDRIFKRGDTPLIELSTPWRSSGLLGELPRPLCPVGTFLVPDLDRPFRHP